MLVARAISFYRRYFDLTPSQIIFWAHFSHSVNDNNDLATHASTLLVRMCGVTPPIPLVSPLLDAIYEAITTSPVTLVS